MRHLFLLCLLVPFAAYANISPADLVKVTPKNNPNCVEYYSYNNEMYCSTTALHKEPFDPQVKNYEKQKIIFDNRPWQAAWGQQTPEITTVEYIPFGTNVEAWQELVTSQFMPGIQDKITPKEFADKFIIGLKNAGFSPIVTFIKNTPDKTIFEFRIVSPANQIQDEIQMITKGKDGFYILHYVIKKSDMGKANRDIWLQLLEQSKIPG